MTKSKKLNDSTPEEWDKASKESKPAAHHIYVDPYDTTFESTSDGSTADYSAGWLDVYMTLQL